MPGAIAAIMSDSVWLHVLIIRNIHETEGAKNAVTVVAVEGPESHKHFH
jgi:hypothetical protein